MPNIKFSDEVTLAPWMKIVDNKKKTSLFITNKGESKSALWAWTKDKPGECPPMVQLKVKGVMVWDDSARQEFFEKWIEKNLSSLTGSPKHEVDIDNLPNDNEKTDDLPF